MDGVQLAQGYKATSRRQFTFYLIDLGKMKDLVDLGATLWFGTWNPWIGNPAPSSLSHCSMKDPILTLIKTLY